MNSPLRTVLQAVAERPDVAGAVIVSDEGLVVDAVLPESLEPDAVAALAATALRSLNALGEAAAFGPPAEAVIESPRGSIVMHRLPGRGVLVVLADEAGDLGTLLYELRRHGPALSAVV